jgi:3-hydroxyisobutyrate dehydrogenase
MGFPMAHLLVQEYKLIALDSNPATLDRASKDGMEIAESMADFSDCEIIFTMLPGCQAVDATMTSLSNEISSLASSKVFVDCSTVSPSTSTRWHEAWAARGHAMLDAPVSGGVKGATDGTLTFMVGGEEQCIERARPFLELMGQGLIPCGGAGAGAATKLCNNLALAAQMVG